MASACPPGSWMLPPNDLCSAYAETQAWELIDASGTFGYHRRRNWFTPKSADYWCEFRDRNGEVVFVDQLDRVMPVTWPSRGLRFAGWVTMIAPVAGAVALSGWAGLLRPGD